MSAAQPFNPRLVIGLIVAGVTAFAAMLLLIAYGNFGSGRDGRAHALSVAAVGFKGLVGLVGEFREAHLDEDESSWSDHLLVVTLEVRNNEGEVSRLLEQRSGYPTVIILPKWITVQDPERRGWVRVVAPAAGAAAGPLLGKDVRVSPSSDEAPGFVAGTDLLAGLDIPIPPSPQRIEGPGLTSLAELPGGGALIAQIGDEPHYVIADPDLLNNHGLRDPTRARAALAVIDRMNDQGDFVDFDLTMNGLGGAAAGRPNMLRVVFEPPFLVMTLALVAAALLAGLHGAFRFGPTRREERAIAFGKSALVENSAGLIRLAGREARLGGAYADVVRQETARTTGAPAWLQSGDLDSYLNRLSKPGTPSFSELAARVDRAQDRHELMAAARALFQWKKDIIR